MECPTAAPIALARRCSPADRAAAAELLYLSSGGLYDRYAGSRETAVEVLEKALAREGTTASADVVHVAEIDGGVVAAMAAMPYDDWTARANAFLRATLGTLPWRRWPRALLTHRLTGRRVPEPPRSSFYIDSLATDPAWRRRGAGRALLHEATRLARVKGLDSVALDAWADNEPALALYRSEGFREVARAPRSATLPGGVSLLKDI